MPLFHLGKVGRQHKLPEPQWRPACRELTSDPWPGTKSPQRSGCDRQLTGIPFRMTVNLDAFFAQVGAAVTAE